MAARATGRKHAELERNFNSSPVFDLDVMHHPERVMLYELPQGFLEGEFSFMPWGGGCRCPTVAIWWDAELQRWVKVCYITLAPIFQPGGPGISCPKPQSRTPTCGGPAAIGISLRGEVGYGRPHSSGAPSIPLFQRQVLVLGEQQVEVEAPEGEDENH